MKAKGGFTLVEILIVVVILGILAAIVIPQFTNASTEAKESSLVTNLQAVRSQIELYKIQHTDALPEAGGATFEQCMIGQTELDGDVWAAGNTYGPYMRVLPPNPFNDDNSVDVDGTIGDGNAGWEYNSTTGEFQADDGGTSPDSTAHEDL